MYKKILFGTCILLTTIFLFFNFCFANDASNMLENATNSIRNAVGGAENAIENATGDISNTSKNATEDVENTTNSMTDDSTKKDTNNETSDNGYLATRTSAGTENTTFMGMTATAWTWLIMGIAAIAIVSLVLYYGNQLKSSNYDDRD